MFNPAHSQRTRLLPTLAIALIILLHFWAGLKYSLAIPAWEAYDEPGHFGYIVTILNDHRLPQNSDPVLNNERIQPPLYYLVQAIFLSVAGSDVHGFHFPNPNSYFFFGQARNYAIVPSHFTDDERKVETALHLVRLGSLLMSMLAIPFAWLAARRAFASQSKLALMAATVFALWPQFLFSSSTVTNDGPGVVIGAAVTWLLLRRPRRWRTNMVCLCLIMVGAAIKLNVLPMMVVLVGAVISTSPNPGTLSQKAKKQGQGDRRGFKLAFFLFAMLLLAAFFVLLRALPSILLPFSPAMPVTILNRLLSQHGILLILQALYFALRSSFALFGWGNVPLPAWIQLLWVISAGVAGLGLLRVQKNYNWMLSISILVVLIIAALALVLFYDDITLIPGRYLLPGLCAFSVALVTGWQRFRLGRVIGYAAVIGLMILTLAVPLFLQEAYEYPLKLATPPAKIISFHRDSDGLTSVSAPITFYQR